ncbi:MAG: DNA-3-methyladenine glycosylase I [Gammaproteobacteria bacterium]|jgi:DNA-3-methyladenine glycosylase I|nr:DNA-3-methyladenine glycosylase I [Gammaproteobacteria bacterium]
MNRCQWAGTDPLYHRYHDKEWGVPVHNDRKLFEFIILEGAQAGLSWITVLKKRAAYKEAFDNFDFNKVAKYKETKVKQLMNNAGIIRNQLKIRSAIKNAQAFIKIREEFGTFNKYIWQFVGNKPIQNKWRNMKELPATSAVSDELSKDLKKRGFSFVGSTIIYAHMQATGMVNDHTIDCFRYKEVKALSK